MKVQNRTLAITMIQLLAVTFLAIYLFYTYESYSANTGLFVVTVLIGLYGFVRKTQEAMIAAGVAMLIYGGTMLYKAYAGNAIQTLELNDLVWLLVFPLFALIGGLYERILISGDHMKRALIASTDEYDSTELIPVDDLEIEPDKGFVDANRFIEILIEKLNNRVVLSVFLLQIQPFRELRSESGDEGAVMLLNKAADVISHCAHLTETKSYLGNGLFGLILIGMEPMKINMLQNEMDDEFHTLLLTRSRREGIVKVNIRFGSADSPTQGRDFETLINEAKKELNHKSL